MQNWLKLGDYNAICDSCGRKFKASTMRKRWDGLFVCKEDFEYKHPQLSLKVRGDKQYVPIPRPESINTFISSCNLIGSMGIVGYSIVGCSTVDKYFPGILNSTLPGTIKYFFTYDPSGKYPQYANGIYLLPDYIQSGSLSATADYGIVGVSTVNESFMI